MIYLDASYLVRLYYNDPGFEVVRNLAMTATVACAQHGRAEVIVGASPQIPRRQSNDKCLSNRAAGIRS